jgi:flagellar biosynthesis protein FlhA
VKKREAEAAAPVAAPEPPPAPPAPENQELSWEDVRPVDAVGLEVGYRLVPLVDRTKGGDLLARIRGIRRKLTQELGFLVQAVHIRDNLELGPNTYRIRLAGVAIGESVVHPDRELAINPGRVFGPVNGLVTRDPAFGMEAVWIEPNLREHAQSLGYTVVDSATVIATHLSHLIQQHAHELFGHEEAEQLLKNLSKTAPKLVDELVPKSAAARHRRARHAGTARGARADPQRARDRRSAGGSRAAHDGSAAAHRPGQGCPGSTDRPGHRRSRRRVARHHT